MSHYRTRMRGHLTVPGDKSISHRALLFAGIGAGSSTLVGLGTGADIRSTAACLRQFGVTITIGDDVTQVESPGFALWRAPASTLVCGNSMPLCLDAG